MLPHYRKFFVLTAFSTLFFCWQTITAQDRKNFANLLEEINATESKEAHLKENPESLPESFVPLTESSSNFNVESHLDKNLESSANGFEYNLHLIEGDKRKFVFDVKLIENPKSVPFSRMIQISWTMTILHQLVWRNKPFNGARQSGSR